MKTQRFLATCVIFVTTFSLALADEPQPLTDDGPFYSADGKLMPPRDYREWVYLSSGLDMSYVSNATPGHHMFSNIFVNPSAYRSFKQTGVWPDRTVIVLEVRGGENKGSINKGGLYQGTDLMGLEIHVLDRRHTPSGWSFYGFDDEDKPGDLVAKPADCYACHEAHGALDTTFVQFYPTLLQIALQKGTLSSSYLKEMRQ